MGIWKKRGENAVARAAKTSCVGGHNADEIDNINTLAGVVSALALAFVLGLQYMVAPGTQEMSFADFRSLLCKSQDFRSYVHEVFKIEDIGDHSEEYFNFTRLVRPGEYIDIEQLLLTGINAKHGEAEGPSKHIACIRDKDVQTAAAFLFEDFPTPYLRLDRL